MRFSTIFETPFYIVYNPVCGLTPKRPRAGEVMSSFNIPGRTVLIVFEKIKEGDIMSVEDLMRLDAIVSQLRELNENIAILTAVILEK